MLRIAVAFAVLALAYLSLAQGQAPAANSSDCEEMKGLLAQANQQLDAARQEYLAVHAVHAPPPEEGDPHIAELAAQLESDQQVYDRACGVNAGEATGENPATTIAPASAPVQDQAPPAPESGEQPSAGDSASEGNVYYDCDGTEHRSAQPQPPLPPDCPPDSLLARQGRVPTQPGTQGDQDAAVADDQTAAADAATTPPPPESSGAATAGPGVSAKCETRAQIDQGQYIGQSCNYFTRPTLAAGAAANPRPNTYAAGSVVCFECTAYKCNDSNIWEVIDRCDPGSARWQDYDAWKLEGAQGQ